MKELKEIIIPVFIVVLISLIVLLIFEGIGDYIIPYLEALQSNELQERFGFFTLCIMLTLPLIVIAIIIVCGTIICKKLYSILRQVFMKSNLKIDEQVSVCVSIKGLNDIIRPEERKIIQEYYNEKLKPRIKGKLAAYITEHMCDLGYVDRIEPGYERIENFLKNDLQLDAPGFQQIAESHGKLRDALRSYQKYLEKEGLEPLEKDKTLYMEFKQYVSYYNDKLEYPEKNLNIVLNDKWRI